MWLAMIRHCQLHSLKAFPQSTQQYRRKGSSLSGCCNVDCNAGHDKVRLNHRASDLVKNCNAVHPLLLLAQALSVAPQATTLGANFDRVRNPNSFDACNHRPPFSHALIAELRDSSLGASP
eukprot:CAMPEP_0168475102 /NCGR_PEP_ID=MMETSP0228-20121227/61187_1 /TAXON_ID=133427 /ORGANISM="Protoceratium reticulatum, Strain CCCM 535 (=CCMP 1889)" /LENGTH=120 /DNA_ID=CAMNT_0008491157 /DNA_START=163 /DNA_END=523 /DNA_ORIENTATION=+